jgi:5,10-methylene-tetrahydrofolate dehydrogenase/methenyl tetrahydrofolate cyclohydrolase
MLTEKQKKRISDKVEKRELQKKKYEEKKKRVLAELNKNKKWSGL